MFEGLFTTLPGITMSLCAFVGITCILLAFKKLDNDNDKDA
jgi:hypothetical protein